MTSAQLKERIRRLKADYDRRLKEQESAARAYLDEQRTRLTDELLAAVETAEEEYRMSRRKP